jgi:acetolactate synthase-1/2/3 large subunit
LDGIRVTKRSEIADAVAKARSLPGTVIVEFVVEQEDSVYPMVPTGAAVDEMIRRPEPEDTDHNPIYETGSDR